MGTPKVSPGLTDQLKQGSLLQAGSHQISQPSNGQQPLSLALEYASDQKTGELRKVRVNTGSVGKMEEVFGDEKTEYHCSGRF